ncbi:hypothetical protein SISSUDRAFT_1048754 [Sistotremastrum suecicum HHB10207 ss-3]|uniref:F-box domain-containing protein n=1 Tax=Sistotremastrum suecicum HHB10207 ss-3 TaxID=1314776 RepID=A0A166C9B2_9AGAM|nr:hypothetical protein SISSUDRAFT_1048754 [Sistotremastrum suecicum HHB10207 ss-3]
MSTAVDRFPNEIFELILFDLDVRTLVRCKNLSRRFLDIIGNSVTLTYKIELYKDGLEDLPSNHSIAQKLQKLRDRRHSWATMQPVQHIRANIDDLGYLHVSGGLFVCILTPPDEDVDMDGASDEEPEFDFGKPLVDIAESIEGQRDDEDGLNYVVKFMIVQLPNVHTGEGIKLRFLYEMQFRPLEFAFDRSQDLIVIMHFEPGTFEGPDGEDMKRIHLELRTFSENTPHPQAHRPRIGPLDTELDTACTGALDLHIAGDKLALSNNDLLRIWNWKTGDQLACLEMKGTPRSFGFISSDYFIATHGFSTCEPLCLYALGPWPNSGVPDTCILLAHLFLPSIDDPFGENLLVTDNISGSLERPLWAPGRMFQPSDDSIRVINFVSGIDLADLPSDFDDDAEPMEDDIGPTRVTTTVMVVKNLRFIEIANSIMKARSVQDIRIGPSIFHCENWSAGACAFLQAIPPLSPPTRRGDLWTGCVEGSFALLNPLVQKKPSAYYISDFTISGAIAQEGPNALEAPRPRSFTKQATSFFLDFPKERIAFQDRLIPFNSVEGDAPDYYPNIIHQDCLIKIRNGGEKYILEILVFG